MDYACNIFITLSVDLFIAADDTEGECYKYSDCTHTIWVYTGYVYVELYSCLNISP